MIECYWRQQELLTLHLKLPVRAPAHTGRVCEGANKPPLAAAGASKRGGDLKFVRLAGTFMSLS
jgi:hypothetical protein